MSQALGRLMVLQAHIDNNTQDPLLPRLTNTFTNDSGSFTLGQSQCLTVRQSPSAICTGSDGDNHLSLSEVQSVSVSNFKNGVLRIESCPQIQTIQVTGSKVYTSDAQIQSVNLDTSESSLFNCTIQSFAIQQSDFNGFGNTYSGAASIGGGQTYSEKEIFNGALSLTGQAQLVINGAACSSITVNQSNFISNSCKASGSLTVTDGQVMDISSTFQDASLSGDDTTAAFQKSTFQGQFSLTDGQVTLNSTIHQGQISLQNAQVNGQTVTAQGSVSFQTGNLVLASGTFQGSVSITDAATATSDNQFQGSVTLNDGSLDSSNNEYSGTFSQTGGNISSFSDTFQGPVTATGLVGPTIFRSAQGVTTMDIEGDGGASLLISDTNPQTLTVKGFGHVRISGCKVSTLTASDCADITLEDSQIQTASVSDSAYLNTGSSTINNLTLDTVGLAITQDVSTLTAEDSAVIDRNSTITQTGGSLICNGSTVTGTNLVINSTGGTIQQATGCTISANGTAVTTADKNTVITTTGGAITNNGLSLGIGFNVLNQAASVLFDGTNLDVECTTGQVNITSTESSVNVLAHTNITEQAVTGSISELANTGISETTTGGDITEISSGNISMTAQGGNLSGTSSTGSVSFNAQTSASITSAGTISLTATTSVTITAPAINLDD
jgi:hypothetical protein